MATGTTFRRKVDTVMRHTQNQHRVRDERGSAILEIALSSLIFLSFLFGILEISLAVYSYHVVAESAREATRYAIVRGSTFSSNTCTTPGWAICMAQPADIQTYVRNLNLGLNPNNVTVTTAWSAYPAGVTCKPLAGCNNPGNLVTVTVKYNFPLSIPFVPPSTLAMSSSSAMVISQ